MYQNEKSFDSENKKTAITAAPLKQLFSRNTAVSLMDNRLSSVVQKKQVEALSHKHNVTAIDWSVDAANNPATVQRVVSKEKWTGGGGEIKNGTVMWASDLVPKRLFHSRDEALHAENQNMLKAKINIHKKRVPTFYTYMHTDEENTLGSSNQGPHVIAEVNINDFIASLSTREKINNAFKALAENSADIKNKAITELRMGTIPEQVWMGRLNRMIDEYEQAYQMYMQLNALKEQSAVIKLQQYLLKRLMNMHPYATFMWNMPEPKADEGYKKNIGGGGEGKGRVHAMEDEAARGFFKNLEEFDLHKEKVMTMMTSMAQPSQKKIKKTVSKKKTQAVKSAASAAVAMEEDE